ncbi:MAG: ribulose-phosphate 3-epimerase [Clostridium sp.]|nr:ribulose-phosphate 3-epimerase [Clostridium sp.]
MSKIIVSPSILSADFANLQSEVEELEEAGADWIHIDVMDGHFVPNLTIGAPVVKAIKPHTNIPLDVHLMIENPQNYIEDFVKAGANIITFHYEATKEMTEDVISHIKSHDILVGLSIKPKTEPQEILKYLLMVDMVLIMTVEPGFGGQSFMEDCAKKIPVIRQNAPENLIIQVDGGINEKTAKTCIDLGANSLVAGSYIFKSTDMEEAIKSLR